MGLIRDHKEARPSRFLKGEQVLLLLQGIGTQLAEPIYLARELVALEVEVDPRRGPRRAAEPPGLATTAIRCWAD
jgi:hypothetical protein